MLLLLQRTLALANIALTIKMISREVRDVTIRNILSASSVLFYAFFLIQTLSYKVYFIN